MEKNNIEELFEQGNSAYENGNLEEAFHFYKSAADLGHAQAQSYLAWQLFHGKGCCKVDWALASHYWELAATQGLPRAQANLGLSYRDGTGVKKDLQKAQYWLEKSVAGGDAYGALHLGRFYLMKAKNLQVYMGNGILEKLSVCGKEVLNQNVEKASSLFKQAIEGGELMAYNYLVDIAIEFEKNGEKALEIIKTIEQIGGQLNAKQAVFYASAILKDANATAENLTHAIALLKMAIECDSGKAAVILAECYMNGLGVDKDEEMAKRYYYAAQRLDPSLKYLSKQNIRKEERTMETKG